MKGFVQCKIRNLIVTDAPTTTTKPTTTTTTTDPGKAPEQYVDYDWQDFFVTKGELKTLKELAKPNRKK